jgi:hypothetical protein
MIKAKQDSMIQKGEQMYYNHYSRNKNGTQTRGNEEPTPPDMNSGTKVDNYGPNYYSKHP